MLRRGFALGVVGFVLGCSLPAQAQVRPDRGSDRRDSYVRFGIGPGYSSGEYRFSGRSRPQSQQPTTPLTFATTLHSANGEFNVAVGHAVVPQLAVAGSGTLRVARVLGEGRVAWTEIDGAVLFDLGAILDFYPWPVEGAHFLAGGAWAGGAFYYSTAAIGSPDNIVEPEEVGGPSLEVGAGYRFTPRFDLLLRASYAWLEGAHSDYRPLGATVLASWLHF